MVAPHFLCFMFMQSKVNWMENYTLVLQKIYVVDFRNIIVSGASRPDKEHLLI